MLDKEIEIFKKKVKELIIKILPSSSTDVEEFKEDVWEQLAKLYYMYDLDAQKKAFREVIQEITKRVGEGDWALIQKKLYYREKKKPEVD